MGELQKQTTIMYRCTVMRVHALEKCSTYRIINKVLIAGTIHEIIYVQESMKNHGISKLFINTKCGISG